MTIGRLYIGFSKTSPVTWLWGTEKYLCGCRVVDVGPWYFELFAKQCKCSNCDQHVCQCYCDKCSYTVEECDCNFPEES